MPGGNDYNEPKTAQHRRGKQAVLNESWPRSDQAGGHARGIERVISRFQVAWSERGRVHLNQHQEDA